MRSVAALFLALGLPVLADEGLSNIQVTPKDCMAVNGHMGCSPQHTRICIYKVPRTNRETTMDMGGSCTPPATDASRKRDITSRSPVPPPDVLEEIYARPIDGSSSRLRWSPRMRARALVPTSRSAPGNTASSNEATVVPDVAGASPPDHGPNPAADNAAVSVPDIAGGSAPAGDPSTGLDAASTADTNSGLFGADPGLAETANSANTGHDAPAVPAAKTPSTGLGPKKGPATDPAQQQPADNRPGSETEYETDREFETDLDSEFDGKSSLSMADGPGEAPESFMAQTPTKKKKPRFWMTSRECRTRRDSVKTCLGGRRMCRFKAMRTGQLRYAPMAGSCRPAGGSMLMRGGGGHGPKGGHGKKSGPTTVIINAGDINTNTNTNTNSRGPSRSRHPRLRGVAGPTAGAMGGSWERVKSKMRMAGGRKSSKVGAGSSNRTLSGDGRPSATEPPKLESPWIYKSPQNAECDKRGGTTGCHGGKVTCIYRNDNGKFHIKHLDTACSWRIVNPDWRGKDIVA